MCFDTVDARYKHEDTKCLDADPEGKRKRARTGNGWQYKI
jgi:hypothetical protein